MQDADYIKYDIWVGTFEGEKFVWKITKSFSDFEKAYKFYKDFSVKQMQFTDKDLYAEWGCGRIDIELRQGEKKLNWMGMFARKTDKKAHENDPDPEKEEED